MNLQTFRYAVGGSVNTALGLLLYYILFKFVLREQEVNLGFYAFKPHVAALIITSAINVVLGFIIMRWVVFTESSIPPRIQLFRYVTVCLFNLFVNYIFLKIFVETLHVYPTIAQTLTVVLVIIISYLAQKHYSFKT